MRDLAILAIHLIATVAKLLLPGVARSILSESLLLEHQLLILNRSRARAPNLRSTDRIIASLCAGLMRPARLLRSAIVLKPSTLMAFHRAFVEMKWRNPRFGCRRIAQQIAFLFGVEIDKDVVRRVRLGRPVLAVCGRVTLNSPHTGTMTLKEMGQQVHTRANGGIPRSLHERAWDEADMLIASLRGIGR
jgi:hypothetical protein